MKHIYNCYGDCIDDVTLELKSEKFGHYDKDGSLIIHWEKESEDVDKYGFDKKNIEKNGSYIIETELPKGTKLCRYGAGNGRMTTLAGSCYEHLALPYRKESVQYHEYLVSADGIMVKCIVTQGKVSKMFDSPGGAIQFLHKQSIDKEMYDGKLREDLSWLKAKN